MILKDEIEAQAQHLGVNESDVQRDYVNDWLLVGIYTASVLKDILILKGGNCFRKAYFPHTRFSSDLDFATETAIDEETLFQGLTKVCAFAKEAAGIDFDFDRTRVGRKKGFDDDKVVYEARLYFKDFYGNSDHITIRVKLDITEFDRIYLPTQSRRLIHPYSDANACTAAMRCLKLEELIASKLVCLLQRRHSLDLFDYVYSVFFAGEIAVDKKEIVGTFLKKTIFERHPGAVKNLLLKVPVQIFRGVWTRYLVCPRTSIISFETAVERFQESIVELFGGYSDQWGDRVFFSAELRNTIMDAASSMTLLRFSYDGLDRLVEPYSLAYKRRKDGVAREYFYGWDQSGGSSRKPGIRMFVSAKIGTMENTKGAFEPQFPIELSKNVESGRKDYFNRPFSAGRRRRVSGSFTHTAGETHVVVCSSCGKEFRRKTRSTIIRRHRDSYGNECYGRYGHLM